MSHPWPSEAFALADLLDSGLYGAELTAALHEHFPSAKRADIYYAIGIAASLRLADIALEQPQFKDENKPELDGAVAWAP